MFVDHYPVQASGWS